MIRKSARWLSRLLWTAVVSLLIVVATYVSLGRYYINYVDDYEQLLLQRFTAHTGLPLKVAQLRGHWSKLAPVFVMEKVILPAPDGDTVLTIERLSFQINPLVSLLKRDIHIGKLFVEGVQCTLLETEPGRWQLKGYPSSGTETDSFDGAIDLVLSVDTIELAEAQLQLDFYQGEDAQLTVPELSLHRSGDFRRLRLLANVDQSERPLIAIAETRGDPRQLREFSGRAYMKLEQLDFSSQLPAMQALGIELREAIFDSEIWVDWRSGSEIVAQGHISTPYLDIAALSGERLSPLYDLALSFRLEKNAANDWRAWVPSFHIRWQDERLVFDNMALEFADSAAHFAIPRLSVDQAVKHLLAVNLLAEPEQQLIETLSPQGVLRNIHASLRFPLTTGQSNEINKSRFTLRANLAEVSIESWQGAPGAYNISGYLEAQPLSGMVELDARDMQLHFPQVYHHRLAFQSALGQVRWRIDPERVRVHSGPLAVVAEYGAATALLSLDLPLHKGSGDPLMDLSIGIRDADAGARHLLIPYFLNQDFLDWMADSVPRGHVIEGGFVYRGSLLGHDYLDRTVQLFFDIDNTTLNFHPDWPPLNDISGLVMIDDGAVRVEPDKARMFDLNIEDAVVTVDPIADGMWLKVDAKGSGNASQALKIVNHSLINRLVDGAFDNWQLNGNASATVDLGIPLAGSQRPRTIDVAVELLASELNIPALGLQLTELNGPIHYDSGRGISSSAISASLYGRPLKAAVSQDNSGGVTVAIQGSAAIKDVATWANQPALRFISGETDFDARVFIAGKAAEDEKISEFFLRSNLQGVKIDVPAPLGKAAEQAMALQLRYPLAGEKRQLDIRLRDRAALQLRMDNSKAVSGVLNLGSGVQGEHYPGLFSVTGAIDDFELEQWRPVLDQYAAEAKRLAGDNPVPAGLQLAVSHLRIGRFNGFAQQLEQLTLDMRQREDGWWLSVLSPVFDTELLIPTDETLPLIVRLDKLRLPDGALSGDGDDDRAGILSSINLAELKPFAAYVAIAELRVGEQHYGSLNFELRTEPEKLQLKNLGGYIRGVRIGIEKPAHFEWLSTPTGSQSHLRGDFDFSDIGKVLGQWQYERLIESKYGMGSADLSWPGRPDEWRLQSSSGPLSIRLKDGRFLKASETAEGTMKMVGIVNLANVMRRLKLDFSDLTDKGISFDQVEGEALLADQKLRITDELVIKSPSSRFLLRGEANLATRQLDMELVATLPVASNLPWIAALAGGIPTAAGVYVASKIFEDQFEKFSSAIYTIEGDWNAPDLEFKRVFDTTRSGTSQPSSSANTSAKPQEK